MNWQNSILEVTLNQKDLGKIAHSSLLNMKGSLCAQCQRTQTHLWITWLWYSKVISESSSILKKKNNCWCLNSNKFNYHCWWFKLWKKFWHSLPLCCLQSTVARMWFQTYLSISEALSVTTPRLLLRAGWDMSAWVCDPPHSQESHEAAAWAETPGKVLPRTCLFQGRLFSSRTKVNGVADH